jgi:RNA recognition motif. (a.k.a. RRM, RBD, or RNP domain)
VGLLSMQEFGQVLSCAVLKDHNGKSKQVGFVQMSSLEEATSALCLNGKEVIHSWILPFRPRKYFL